jgi:signal peptidase II
MAYRSFRTWLIALALLGVILDQASKYFVFYRLCDPDPEKSLTEYPIINGAFDLYVSYDRKPAEGPLRNLSSNRMPHVNKGALFGLGNEGARLFGMRIRVDPDDANAFFALVSVIAAVAIVIWSFRRRTASDRLLCLALGLILGGTLGNLYDRVVFGGVRDFLYYHFLFNWPVFNIADCCLVVGAFLLLAQAFLTHPAPHPKEAPVSVSEPIRATPEIARAIT